MNEIKDSTESAW